MRKRTIPGGAPDAAPATDRQFVEALAKGLEVLRAFRQGDVELSNQEFVARTGLPKATISRLTYTLSKLGYLAYNYRTGSYRLDAPAMSLGYNYLAGLGVRRLAKPLMQALADHAGAPVALGARDRMSMVYLECCRSSSAITLAIEVGAHIKVASSSLGRAYIAGLTAPERSSLMDELAEHENENWPQVKDGIDEALEIYEKYGYCLSLGNWKSDVNSVGVPYRPSDGSPVLAFNCGGPSFMLDRQRLVEDIAPRLIAMVRSLETNAPTA
ncbi:IclR family transcriptional regulator [Rhizobium leguminosarum]|uniref:IclR family transcriptional regulator n=1 Tax=Rhizobium leguminosarum TaxID=384 RepID=UPI001C93FEB0|nr:IclR family transcriptional regulator [Rhizobium leguminosarum]MBY5406437.1 IclR family transcriptional regulator [Rhizobium leguminosarum]